MRTTSPVHAASPVRTAYPLPRGLILEDDPHARVRLYFSTSSRVPSVELLSTTTTSISTPSIDLASTRSMSVASVGRSLNAGTMTDSFGVTLGLFTRTRTTRRLFRE